VKFSHFKLILAGFIKQFKFDSLIEETTNNLVLFSSSCYWRFF